MNITVVIPLYNKQEAIIRAIQSVVNQTKQPNEVIIVNDGSTDGSEQLVLALRNPIVRLINQPNAGVSAARNKGIEEAKEKWIAFLDADDEWDPVFLENMQVLMLKYPECMVLASAYKFKDNHGQIKNIVLNKIPFKCNQGILSNYFEVASCSHPPIWSSAVLIEKDAITSIGGFPAGIKAGEDLLTWARLNAKFKIAYTTKPLATFYLIAAHNYEDKPNRIPDPGDRVSKALYALRDQIKVEDKSSFFKYVAHWHKMRASIYLRLGSFKLALKHCFTAIRFDPFNLKVWIYIIITFLPLNLRLKIFKELGS